MSEAHPPSLVPNRISLPPEDDQGEGDPERLKACPRKLDYVMLDASSGRWAPARCKANFCPWCGPTNAFLIGGAIALAGPDRALTLTQVGDDWQTVRARMYRFRYDLAREVGDFDWCWHVEPNPRGTGHHSHAWQRGRRFVPQEVVSQIARRRGMGEVVWINRYQSRRAAENYGVKLAGVRYGLKEAAAREMIGGYLRANGGRMVHASRGWWRDDEGQAVGQREAMAAWVRSRHDDEHDPESEEPQWQLVRRDQLDRALAGLPGASATSGESQAAPDDPTSA